jgi:hypothetical protein
MRIPSSYLSAAAFLAGALGASACASAVTAGDAVPTPQTAARADEILRLRTREGDVAVLAGTGGRYVTIYDATGAALRSADVESLRRTDPVLFQLLTEATASQGAYLDATLR